MTKDFNKAALARGEGKRTNINLSELMSAEADHYVQQAKYVVNANQLEASAAEELMALRREVKQDHRTAKEANWSEIYGVLNKCSRIYVISTGVTQKNQAAEIQRLFLLIGKPVQVIPGNAQSVEFRRIVEGLNEDDVLFLLSLSGENIGLEGILNILNIKKSVIISITNFKSNWLSGRSTYNLYASSSRSPLPQDWWLQTASTFFILIEIFAFGFVDYQRNLQNL